MSCRPLCVQACLSPHTYTQQVLLLLPLLPQHQPAKLGVSSTADKATVRVDTPTSRSGLHDCLMMLQAHSKSTHTEPQRPRRTAQHGTAHRKVQGNTKTPLPNMSL